MTTFHMAMPISGCLTHNPIGTIDFLEDENGNPLSDTEARSELNKLLEQGHKVMPTSDDCVGFDVFGGGCPGHEPLTSIVRENQKINKSSFTVVYEWDCPNCCSNHSAFGYEPTGNAGLFCVDCDAVIDVIAD